MKLAHLILAHNKPEQLARLVGRLAHPDADVYIHVDAKTNIQPFKKLGSIPNVYFILNRVAVYWGAFNVVQATINGFRQIISSGKAYSYVNLLSGVDYPLQPADAFQTYLNANPGKAFMNALVAETHWLEALPRVQKYHLNNYHFPVRNTVQRLMNKMLPQRKLPNNMVLVGRSQWFTAAADCVKYILDYWDSHPAFCRFMKLTWAPDEFVFQTILYNSPMRDCIVHDDLRYIDWSAGGASPKILTMHDADTLKTSGRYFARKFDIDKDAAILRYIDEHLLNVRV